MFFIDLKPEILSKYILKYTHTNLDKSLIEKTCIVLKESIIQNNTSPLQDLLAELINQNLLIETQVLLNGLRKYLDSRDFNYSVQRGNKIEGKFEKQNILWGVHYVKHSQLVSQLLKVLDNNLNNIKNLTSDVCNQNSTFGSISFTCKQLMQNPKQIFSFALLSSAQWLPSVLAETTNTCIDDICYPDLPEAASTAEKYLANVEFYRGFDYTDYQVASQFFHIFNQTEWSEIISNGVLISSDNHAQTYQRSLRVALSHHVSTIALESPHEHLDCESIAAGDRLHLPELLSLYAGYDKNKKCIGWDNAEHTADLDTLMELYKNINILTVWQKAIDQQIEKFGDHNKLFVIEKNISDFQRFLHDSLDNHKKAIDYFKFDLNINVGSTKKDLVKALQQQNFKNLFKLYDLIKEVNEKLVKKIMEYQAQNFDALVAIKKRNRSLIKTLKSNHPKPLLAIAGLKHLFKEVPDSNDPKFLNLDKNDHQFEIIKEFKKHKDWAILVPKPR